MYGWAKDLFPYNRSITGNGVRRTLSYIKELLPDLEVHEVESGKKVFDWTVPQEWNVNEAYIENEDGQRIVDFNDNNLHLVGYSEPINLKLPLDELENHLYSLPDQPNAIPFITSYYKKRWGFCLTENKRKMLKQGIYNVYIDSELTDGSLTYGELYIPGETEEEILISTYICHPSMANNELSGPVVAVAVAQWLHSRNKSRYSYRILFIPETIGSIVYLSEHWEELKKNVVAGYVLTCIGDNREYSYLRTRHGNTLADRAAIHILNSTVKSFNLYSYLVRGSDERNYCSPGIDLPVGSIMRSKYSTYPEYHTSLDNLELISAAGLEGGFDVVCKTIDALENNYYYKAVFMCEPQLGKRNLYPDLSTGYVDDEIQKTMNILSYADGKTDLIEIAETIEANIQECAVIAEKLERHGLLERV